MSGLVGHTMYAVLGAQAAAARNLPLAGIALRHFPSYVAGAYIGSDIQTMPEAICVDTGREVGYGTVPLAKSPLTGGAVRPFLLHTPTGDLSPLSVHQGFYGRAHLVFGWPEREKTLRVPWDHLPDYFAAVCDDLAETGDAGERALAYALGWMVHVVSDSLIKGQQPGIELHLLDGRYTPRNRPVQDLVTFHEVGGRELRLDWPGIFAALAETPVESIQLHYMRCATPRGRLGGLFMDGWKPENEATLRCILAENRRWVGHHADDVLADMTLRDGDCSAAAQATSGLHYAEMIEAATKAGFRPMLQQIAEAIVAMFEATHQRSKRLASLSAGERLSFDELTQRWRRAPALLPAAK